MKKQAILLIHFGTTHDDTREKTIDVFEKRWKAYFRIVMYSRPLLQE